MHVSMEYFHGDFEYIKKMKDRNPKIRKNSLQQIEYNETQV